ncbi:MAG: response regulator [Planctomycetota bacterium]|nr:response regulator [Planctomycetota bacterium]
MDDNYAWRAMMASRLGEDCDVTQAGNGVEAAAVLQHQAFDVIVSDLDMPGMDGTMLTLGILMGEIPTPASVSPPMLVVTGLDGDQRRVKALSQADNVVAVFKKPLDLEVLHSAVKRVAQGDVDGVRQLADELRSLDDLLESA